MRATYSYDRRWLFDRITEQMIRTRVILTVTMQGLAG